jgi:DNA-binding NarL/FixJ family response regulator
LTRILIVDDHELIRMAIQQFLANQPDLEVVGTATDGATAIRLSTELKPDVILMDLAMPEVDGVEATRQITALLPDTRVLVLTSFSDRERILDAIDAGAVGYLLDAAPDELLSGVGCGPGESPAQAARPGARNASERGEPSPREMDVLILVARASQQADVQRSASARRRLRRTWSACSSALAYRTAPRRRSGRTYRGLLNG